MSTAGSTPRSRDSGTLAAQAEERFFALDHVGVVRHFEGVGLDRVIEAVSSMVHTGNAKVEQATEQVRGRLVYTCISTPWAKEALTLWLTATLVEGVGVVVDAKVFHQTDESAVADEELSRLMARLEEQVGGRRPD